MAFICASEDKAGTEQKRSHSGLWRVFVTQAADAAKTLSPGFTAAKMKCKKCGRTIEIE